MKNCLVTKLKETVNNSNLKKLGVTSFKMNNNNTEADNIIIRSNLQGHTPSLKLIGGTFTDNTTQKNIESLSKFNIAASQNDITFEIHDKYAITSVELPEINTVSYDMDLSIFKYSPLTHIKILTTSASKLVNVHGVLGEFTTESIAEIRMEYVNLTGNLSSLARFTSLRIILFGAANVEGALQDIAPLLSLTSCKLKSGANINGTVEEFAAYQSEHGRESGTMLLYMLGSKVKFNGQVVSNEFDLSYSATGVTVSVHNGALLATYTKANDTWTYA